MMGYIPPPPPRPFSLVEPCDTIDWTGQWTEECAAYHARLDLARCFGWSPPAPANEGGGRPRRFWTIMLQIGELRMGF